MRTLLVQNGLWAAGRALTVAVLALIGLSAGAGCVLFPQALPWAILGLAGLLLLWVMPDLATVPARLAGIALIPFAVSVLAVPAYYAIILPGVPWISVRRVVFAVFAFAVAITISGSSKARSDLVTRLKVSPVVSSLIVAYFTINILATLTATRVGPAISDTMNSILFGLLPFTAVVLFVRTESAVRRFFVACVACVFIDMLLGAIESHLHRPFLIYALPPDMRSQLLAQAAGYSGLLEATGMRNGMTRALSIFNTALSWGEMSAMMSPLAAYFAAFGRSNTARVAGIAGVVASFVSVFLSGSRGGYVGFIAAALLFWCLLVLRTIRARPNSLIGPTALCLCAILSVATLSSVFFVGRVHTAVLGGGEVQSSNDGRAEQWAMAKPKIFARPILGYGPGSSAEIVGWVNMAGAPSLDSYAITLLIGVGVPGCLAFFGMTIAAALGSFWRFIKVTSPVDGYGLSLGCALVAYTLYRLTLSQAENNTIMFMLLGLAVSVANLARASVPSAKSREQGIGR